MTSPRSALAGRVRMAVTAALAVALVAATLAGGGTASAGDLPGDTGEVLRGLRYSAACPGGYAVEDSGGACSHGPDPAPPGVDVRERPTVAELRDEAAGTRAGDGAEEAGAVPCYGDGVSGKRVQVVYAVAADRADRYGSVVDLIRGYAARTDLAFANSAARDGGVRHVRWVTDSGCRLAVDRVVLSATGDDSIANTRAELRSLGYTSDDRKYLVFADATVYCGISYVAGDARPDASNPANSGATVSRVDAACWGGTASVPAHELAHALGAVQLAAPHSNGAWHCTDEHDRLCYDDGSGAALSYLCTTSQEPLLDCNGDDYFNVAPPPGSWLATHWNLASSAFLEAAEPEPPPAPAPATTEPASGPPSVATGTTAVVPTGTGARVRRHATEFNGSLTRVRRVRTFRFAASAGDLVSRARFRGVRRIRLVVRDSAGEVVADRRLRSGRSVVRAVGAGSYRVTVRGKRGARFTVRVVRNL